MIEMPMMRGHYFKSAAALCTALAAGAHAQELPRELPHEHPMAKAARAGDAKAQHRIGYYYDTGKYVQKDLTQASIWYKKAADQDLLKAQYAYAYMLAFEKKRATGL